jgi:hypothetical protein
MGLPVGRPDFVNLDDFVKAAHPRLTWCYFLLMIMGTLRVAGVGSGSEVRPVDAIQLFVDVFGYSGLALVWWQGTVAGVSCTHRGS